MGFCKGLSEIMSGNVGFHSWCLRGSLLDFCISMSGMVSESWVFDSWRLEVILLAFGEGKSGMALQVIVGSWRFDCWCVVGSLLEFFISMLGISSGSVGFGRWSFEGLLLELSEGTSLIVLGS